MKTPPPVGGRGQPLGGDRAVYAAWSKCYHHHEKIDQNHRKIKLEIGYSRFVFIQVNASVNTNLCWRIFKNDEISIFEPILVWYFTRES